MKKLISLLLACALLLTCAVLPAVAEDALSADSEEALVKATAINRSFVSYVLADSSKFGKVSSVSFATIDRACIITDKKPDGHFEKLTVIKVVE